MGDNVGKGDDKGVPIGERVWVGSAVTVTIVVGCGVWIGGTARWAAMVFAGSSAVGSGDSAELQPARQR